MRPRPRRTCVPARRAPAAHEHVASGLDEGVTQPGRAVGARPRPNPHPCILAVIGIVRQRAWQDTLSIVWALYKEDGARACLSGRDNIVER